MNMVLRKMKPEDAREVSLIEKTVFSLPWSEKSFHDAVIREDTVYVVAEEDGKITGYAGAWGVLGEADVTNVCVAPEFRRKGIANELLQFLIRQGRETGIDAFFLEVRESNTAAITLYEKNGFQKIGLRKNFYERPVENGIVMSLTFF